MMKSKMMKSRTALALMSAILMGGSTSAWANNTAKFETKINVLKTELCEFEVETYRGDSWALTWEESNSQTKESSLSVNGGLDGMPKFVEVKFSNDSGPTCNLAGMKFGASGARGVEITDKGIFKAKAGSGFWEYMPTVTKFVAYKDRSAMVSDMTKNTSERLAAEDIKVRDAKGQEYTSVDTAAHRVGAEVELEGTTQKLMALTHNYLRADGVTPLNYGGQTQAASLKTVLRTPIQSALIGVGVLVAKNPVNADGNGDASVLGDIKEVSLPFTVTVELP